MTLSFDRHDKQTFGTAVGTQGIVTSATLQLSDDDVYSMTLSDGTQSYSASNLIVDITIPQVRIILPTQLRMRC